MIATVRDATRAHDPRVPILSVRTLADAAAYAAEAVGKTIVTLFTRFPHVSSASCPRRSGARRPDIRQPDGNPFPLETALLRLEEARQRNRRITTHMYLGGGK